MQGDDSGLLVRRKGRAMPEELGRGGQQAEHIDWRKSVLLNLVIQATYRLTVATCRHAATTVFPANAHCICATSPSWHACNSHFSAVV